MSQQTQSQADESDDSDSIAETLISEVEFLDGLLSALDTGDLEDMSDEELVRARSALKELESTVESARKDQADDVLEDRIDVGERLHGLQRVESHNKYLKEDVGTVIGRAASQGIDYTEFVDVKVSDLADSYPDLAEIGRYEYTYFM